MELKFVVGMLIVAIGFALMLPLDEKDDTDNAPPQIAQQKTPERKPDFPVSARSYARSMVSVEEYVALHELIMRESSWNPDARNRKSTAYGLGQLLDQTWDLVGIEKSDDFRIQLIAAHKYVMQRYGSWQKALEFHKRNGYY
jgi:membrane-bound lytic murein transglycosylase MltF